MLARARDLAPVGTRVSVLGGKSVGLRYCAGATGAAGVAVADGESIWSAVLAWVSRVVAGAGAAAVRAWAGLAGGGSSCPPGSMVRGSVG
jgi:hypothetical protein